MPHSRDTYAQFARYYDIYAGDFAEDIPLYLSLCDRSQRILEVGCGTGRVLRAFLAVGFQVDGLDTSPEMLRVARKKLSNHIAAGTLRLLLGSLEEAGIRGAYDRILVTWYTFNYLLEDEERTGFLNQAYDALRPGGILVMDLFYPLSPQAQQAANQWSERWFECDGRRVQLRQRRSMEGDIERREQIYVEGGSEEAIQTRRRYVSKRELEELLRAAGFGNALVCDGYDGGRWHPLSESPAATTSFVVQAQRE